MSRRQGGALGRAALAVLSVVGWGGAAAAGPLAAPGVAAAVQSTSTSGIGATWTTAQGTWVALPMGHLHSASNTFWELLFRPGGASAWTLVTPPGVASNGGLVGVGATGAAAGDGVLVGFQPAKYLRYSPVARTTDGGKKWSTGTLPSGLAPVASSLATGSGGQVLALERPRQGTVVRSTESLTRWSTVTSGQALAATAAGKACDLRSITAVTLAPGGPEVGGDCTTPGVVGLFKDSSRAWQADGPTLEGESAARMKVLRLTTTSAGTVAVVRATAGSSSALLALWRPSGGTWSASAPLRLEGRVVSAGGGTQLSMTVVTASVPGAVQVHTSGGPGTQWSSFAAPRGTQAVAPGPVTSAAGAAPTFTALAVSGSSVTVWDRSGGPWRKVQGFKVPIEYGSSA